ncbi:FAD/FMN-containing dehydrogenase, partial [Emericellopsis cladophorae]
MDALDERSIKFQRMKGQECLPEAMMHDRGAVVPAVVVSPSNESEVVQTLQILTKLDLYHGGQAVSVKSGGHGYFNGATCADIMLNLSAMRQRKIEQNVLTLEPGCLLGHTIDLLAKNHKAVPHGDCFGVGAGGHFTTAGWDILLARRYGLGCQSVVGGRLVLWDGTVWDVGDKDHRDLLYAMRGGAAAGTGVVTKIQLRLEEEPALATWQFVPLTKDDLKHRLVAQRVFQRAESLPRDITVSLRFHYELGEDQRSCSFNVTSLLTAKETLQKLKRHLGPEVSELVSDLTRWNEGSLLDLRLKVASDTLVKNPQMLADMTARSLHDNPRLYWSEQQCLREMERSHLLSRSYWVTNDC